MGVERTALCGITATFLSAPEEHPSASECDRGVRRRLSDSDLLTPRQSAGSRGSNQRAKGELHPRASFQEVVPASIGGDVSTDCSRDRIARSSGLFNRRCRLAANCRIKHPTKKEKYP